MQLKKISRWIVYRLAEAGFFLTLPMLRLPRGLFYRASGPFVRLLVFFVVPRRRIVKNMAAAFGEEYPASARLELARGVQDHFARNLLDCMDQMRSPEHARETVAIEGLENLRSALEAGRGVIALGAHIGNFVLVGTRLGAEGFTFHTLFRLPKDRGIEKIIWRYLPRYRQNVIPSLPRREAVSRILAALRKNEIVFILADNLKKGKVQTHLFGQRVHTSRGPASLALRSGAPVVPMYLVRDSAGSPRLIIEPELRLARTGNLQADIVESTHAIARYLERLIRKYPDQWNWLTVKMRGQGDLSPRKLAARRRLPAT
jgi:KDO2-lipid IV(A) lauroyltransferase